MTSGEKVKAAREKMGLSQSALAKRMHVSQQAVAKYEKIVEQPKLSTVRKIAEALEIPISVLVEDWSKIPPNEIREEMGKHFSKKYSNLQLFAEDTPKSKILSHFDKLNKSGQDKAIEQVALLTKIPEYRKDSE